MSALATVPSPSRTPESDAVVMACRALAAQSEAIDALPEAELRRLLKLIGGTDPAALHRAAATYTETFWAVPQVKAIVAALRPLALATRCSGGSS